MGVVVPRQQENFRKGGREYVAFMWDLCGLQPDEDVLEVGSGAGRLAIPLTEYLTSGTYEGFDVHRARVEWCQREITSRYPNFRFQIVDVFNKTYNLPGRTPPGEFTFPYEDESFDFVFVVSVFTHMLPEGVARYIAEIARVLRRGGRCLASFLLLNDEVIRRIESQPERSDPSSNSVDAALGHDFGNYRVSNPATPEAVIALDEQFVLDLYRDNGLEVTDVRHGSWSRREPSITGGQDVILASG